MTLTRSQFVDRIRFLFSDTPAANSIIGEDLISRPNNQIDGNNRIFLLLNRRITTLTLYDGSNTTVPSGNYSLTADNGKIVFGVGFAPTVRLFADYSWQKLTDDELDEAISIARSSGNFNPDNISETYDLDYASRYVVSVCYEMAAARSADYYTMSAGGKQVSKSELFNHFMELSKKFLADAKALRTDQRTDRGDRDIPSMIDVTSNWSDPYFPSQGGNGSGI